MRAQRIQIQIHNSTKYKYKCSVHHLKHQMKIQIVEPNTKDTIGIFLLLQSEHFQFRIVVDVLVNSQSNIVGAPIGIPYFATFL